MNSSGGYGMAAFIFHLVSPNDRNWVGNRLSDQLQKLVCISRSARIGLSLFSGGDA